MAYIQIGSKFKPFSYLELLQPVMMADQEHKALEELFGLLSSQADIWDKLADELNDPYTYNMYKKYSTDLASSAEELATRGLTPGSRKGLLDMKNRYSKEIVPIEQAYKKREALTAEQRKALERDSSIIFNKDVSNTKLSDFIKNPNLSYQSVSGNMVALLSAQAALALAKAMRELPKKWKSILGGQYFESMILKGYKPEEVLAAAIDDPNAPKELKNVMSLVYESSGVSGWEDSEATQRVKQHIGRGLYSAIGSTEYLNLRNSEYLNPLLRASLNASPAISLVDKAYRVSPITTVTGSDTSKIQENMLFLQEAMENPDILKEKGNRVIRKEAKTKGATWGSYDIDLEYYPHRERLKLLTDKYGTTDPLELLKRMDNEIKTSAIRLNSYIMNITDADLIAKNLRENALSYNRRSGNTGVYEIENNKKGDQVDIDDVNEYFDKKPLIEYDPTTGIVFTGANSEGKVKSFVLDPEIVTGRTISLKDGTVKNKYQYTMDVINQYIKEGDSEGAAHYIGELMNDMYAELNSLSKRQGNTLSPKEEAGG